MKTIKTIPRTNQPAYDKVIKLISRYRYLTISQLQAILAVRGYFHARKILFELWTNGYLERLVLTRAAKRISYSYVFALSRKGARQLRLCFGLENIFYLKPSDKRSTIFLEHTILINNFRICLECLDQKKGDFELTSWKQSKHQVKLRIN